MKTNTWNKANSIFVGCAVVFLIWITYFIYSQLWQPNINVLGQGIEKDRRYLYLPTACTYTDLVQSLKTDSLLKNSASFERVVFFIGSSKLLLKPGRYLLSKQMGNLDLIKLIRSGKQEPVKLILPKLRLPDQLAGFLASKLLIDSADLMQVLVDTAFLAPYGFSPQNVMALFIPNTYKVFWTTDSKGFVSYMYRQYSQFWHADRKRQAAAIGLSPLQVSILASLVDAETNVQSDLPIIAGLYLNRLGKRMPLQSCPSAIFASGDFNIRRVLHKHLNNPSPYNTYLHRGLPPGPIAMPSIAAMNAVLNRSEHRYLYMCASADFVGRHLFTDSYAQHLRNAQKFQQALNTKGILK